MTGVFPKSARANPVMIVGTTIANTLEPGENFVGVVGADDEQFELVPTLDTSAYTAGDVLFDAVEVPNVPRVSNGIVILHSVKVIDTDDQGAEIKLFFFDRSVSFGTFNLTPSISDADARRYEGHMSISTYEDIGGVQVGVSYGIGLVIKPNSTGLWVAALTNGTPTHSANGVTLKFAFLRS